MKRAKIDSSIKISDIFYTNLPISKINSMDFDTEVLRRITLLKKVDSEKIIDKEILFNSKAHFFTRLVCTKNKESILWFIQNESLLLRKILDDVDSESISRIFFNEYIPRLRNFNGYELNKSCLFDPFTTKKNVSFDKNNIKVYFTKIPDLTGSHKVDLVGGYTNLRVEYIRSILINEFKEYLKNEMEILSKLVYKVNDIRILRLFDLLKERRTFESSTLEDVLKFQPPCIFNIISKLESNGHLKYNDRTNLNRYLKNAGVNVDEAIEFIRSRFSTSNHPFDKTYLYNIKHDYGLEGKKADYIINCLTLKGFATTNNVVGCPWAEIEKKSKVFNEYIKRYNLEAGDIEELKNDGVCTVKCQKLLERLKGKNITEKISNPVDFYRVFKN